jgi:mono/diheme cytochrome c family protein
MKREFDLLLKSLFLSLIAAIIILKVCAMPVGAATAAPTAPSQTAGPAPAAASKEACLNCHGPFDKLAGATPSYVAPSGEKIVPHRFVPHNSREAKAIPGCNNCHEPHLVPPTAPALAALPKPDVQWCYTACHHKNNFTLCKDCHK